MGEAVQKSNGKFCPLFLYLALILGVILRLSFPGDIEYKDDEKYMFEASQSIGVTESWPLLGMPSGVKVNNPGMSVWIFPILSKITHASTPPELARAVQILNILALFMLAFFSLHLLPEPERPAWCWATAFAAVNPIAVLYQRKIWAQCTLPFFCVLLWIAWHFRHKRTGAFFWGLLGVCLGQIHMSGFFLATALFIGTVIHERLSRWGSWLLGSMVGAIPLIPWFQYILSKPASESTGLNLLNILQLKFWRYWISDALGIGLNTSLGNSQYWDFMRYPLIEGMGTYLVGICHVLIIIVGILIFVSGIKKIGFVQWIKNSSDTGLAVNSAFLTVGVLLTLSAKVLRHYLIVSFPLEWVWLSRMGLEIRQGQRYLTLIWIAQLFISTVFLIYIHLNHGAPLADYGTAYEFQPR
jgi:hypothetical protein